MQMTSYARPEVLVSTDWLAAHLHDPNLRIVEVEMEPATNVSGHIPGAIFWNIYTDLLKPDMSQKLEPESISRLLSQSGITPETTVIAYGSNPGTGAWIFWLLTLVGHKNVRVLNGSYTKWVQEERSLAPTLATVTPTQYPAISLDQSLRISYKAVSASLNHPQNVLLDVRTEQEYVGEHFMIKPPEPTERAGHIPTAVHLPHLLSFNPDMTYKTANELKALYTENGITPDKTIFPYCAIGARSASVWFVLKYLLGYPNVQNYDGSWHEWSRQPNAPIKVGASLSRAFSP